MTPSAKPQSTVVQAISNQELADWVRQEDVSDPLLPIMAVSATATVIEFLGKDLINRSWEFTAWQWPIVGTPTCGISPSLSAPKLRFELPYAELQAVTSVQVNAEDYTDYTLNGDYIIFDESTIPDEGNPAFRVIYTAGMGAAVDDIPVEIKSGILMLAAYLYDHRGACDSSKALMESGAMTALTPYRKAGLLI